MTSSAEPRCQTVPKASLGAWLARLEGYQIYLPQCEAGVWNYALWRGASDVCLDYPMTVIPAKAFVFRQSEPLLAFRQGEDGGYEVEETTLEVQPAVIVGLRPCEGRAMVLLDEVMERPPADVFYRQRRRATALVGLACNVPPSPDCFCDSVGGSPYGESGLDVLLTDLGDRYFVQALTEQGEALVAAGEGEMAPVDPADRSAVEERHRASLAQMPRRLGSLEDIHRKLADAFDAPLWREESMSCIGCGICTYLCPTCHCFDINDEVMSITPLRGLRIRTWDTCQFADFTMHSSGHNPRPDAAARLRQRVSHKFRYGVEAGLGILCVGCGRCISQCPMGIDLVRILEEVRNRLG